MEFKPTKIEAVLSLFDQNSHNSVEENGTVKWRDGHTTTPEEVSQINTEYDRLIAEYNDQLYARNRKLEYPTVDELTVALYDTDDKAALETKRAAVKVKWPKDNSGPV